MTDLHINIIDKPSIIPENFTQTGSNLDIEITARVTRSIWKALAASDDALRNRLNDCLQEEIDSLIIQHEIDRGSRDEGSLAIAHLLMQYLHPSH